MAQVPYQPYQSTTPAPGGAMDRPERIHEDIPEAAFGANIGRAVEGFGGTLEGVGKELFARAEAMQQLDNEATARERMITAGQGMAVEQAKLESSKGINAKEALLPHLQNLQAIREQYRTGLNPMAARFYDNEMASIQTRFTSMSTAHAGREFKTYLVQNIDARIGSLNDLIRTTPNDANAISKYTGQLQELEKQKADILGQSEATQEFNTSKTLSSFYKSRNEGLADVDPIRSLRQAAKDRDEGRVRGTDIDPMMEHVRRQVYTVGARNTFQSLRNGSDVSLGSEKVTLDRAREAIGKIEGNDYNSTASFKGRTFLGRYQVDQNNLGPWLKQAGMAPMTPAQFVADKKAQDQLFNNIFGSYMDKHGNFNDAASVWFTGRPYAQVQNDPKANDGHWHVSEYVKQANAMLYHTASQTQIAELAQQKGDALGRDAPLAGEYFRQFAQGRYNSDQQQRRTEQFEVRQNFADILASGKFKNFDEMQADPQAIQMMEKAQRVAPDYWRGMPKMFDNYQQSLRVNTSQTRLAELITMYQDNPQKFMEINPLEENQLQRRDLNEVRRLQQQLWKEGHADPKLNKIYNDLSTMYPEEVPKKARDENGYNTYRMGLYYALQQRQDMGLPPPKIEDYKTMHQMLMQPMAGRFFGTNPLWNSRIPSEFSDALREKSPKITEPEIQEQWIRANTQVFLQKINERGPMKDAPPPIASKPSKPPEPPAPSLFEETQADPVTKFLRGHGGKAAGDWIKGKTEEIVGEAKQRRSDVMKLGGEAKSKLEKAQKEATEERERELPPEVIGKRVRALNEEASK